MARIRDVMENLPYIERSQGHIAAIGVTWDETQGI